MAQIAEGYGGTQAPGSAVCWISPSDMAAQVGNMLTRLAAVESKLNQHIMSNVSAISLSDFTQDLGVILTGTLSPAVVIETTSDYALYAYPVGDTPGAIQVDGDTVEILTNQAGTLIPGIFDHLNYRRDMEFQVHEDGLYMVSATATVNLASDVNHGYLSWTITYCSILQAGSDDGATNRGISSNGSVVQFDDIALQVYVNGFVTQYPSHSHVDWFRLTAEDKIRVSIFPRIACDPSPAGSFLPAADLWHNMNLSGVNVTVTRIAGL